MYPRKQLDISWETIAASLLRSPWTQTNTIQALQDLSFGSQTFPALSVRSAFHLALTLYALPPGSEVLVSAVTIPHMVQLLRHHHLVPVPVDLDPLTCQPRLDLLEEHRTPKTRAVLVAHLFGATIDVEPIAAFCTQHNLLLWEDCAQAFTGSLSLGHRDADLTMYSFGTIKTATALGGALVRVRDDALHAEMQATYATWPQQPASRYRSKVLKSSLLKAFSHPTLFQALTTAITRTGRDYDATLMAATRGFPGHDLIPQITARPHPTLLQTLALRLQTVQADHTERRARAGQAIVDALGFAPGLGAYGQNHTFWLFPITAHNPQRLVRSLVSLGLDATCGGTSLFSVPDDERGDSSDATFHMKRTVYVPVYPSIDQRTRDAMIETLKREAIPVQPTQHKEQRRAA